MTEFKYVQRAGGDAPAPAQKPPTSKVIAPGPRPTAIIADDSGPTRRRFLSLLTLCGVQVIDQATSGQEALWKCRKMKPQIAVLDVAMPPGSGYDTALKLADSQIVPHIIVVSSNSQGMVFEPLRKAGVMLLTKPVNDDQFIKEIKAMIADGNA